jgi:phage shock protein PspC (stress-responsive transcriptional regulator)
MPSVDTAPATVAATAPPERDNLLGICHAVGEAFGVNPLYLRLAIVMGMLLAFETTLIVYGAAGVAVLIARLLNRVIAKSGRGRRSASAEAR